MRAQTLIPILFHIIHIPYSLQEECACISFPLFPFGSSSYRSVKCRPSSLSLFQIHTHTHTHTHTHARTYTHTHPYASFLPSAAFYLFFSHILAKYFKQNCFSTFFSLSHFSIIGCQKPNHIIGDKLRCTANLHYSQVKKYFATLSLKILKLLKVSFINFF